jgi:hypothetical protein
MLAAQAAYMEDRATGPPWLASEPKPLIWDRIINPLLAWSQLTFRVDDGSALYYQSFRFRGRDGAVADPGDVVPSLLGVAWYGLLAWLFYRLAARRFEREGYV